MTSPHLRTRLMVASALALGACGGKPAPPETQYGANPELPAPHQYLLPPMHIAPVAKWAAGEVPTVPAGLRAQPSPPG